MSVVVSMLLALCASSCIDGPLGFGGGGSDDNNEPVMTEPFSHRAGLFGADVTRVTFKIDYEAGAEPYTSFQLMTGNPFNLGRTNIEAMFMAAGTSPEIVLPDQLEDMDQLPADFAKQESYTAQQLLDISELYRDVPATETERSFHILFLDGYFADEQGERKNVLGVSIGDTGVIAMFKPVIASTSSERYVEQTTLIHEFGHAVGLVNNGLELVIDHHDETHGAHCNNDDCVMFYQNEGAEGLRTFIQRFITERNPVVFDDDCLDDIAKEGARLRGE